VNRADFLKRLGFGAIAVAVAPKVISEVREAPLKIKEPTIAETDTYCIATTEEPNYMIGADPYVGDCVHHSNGASYVVVAWDKRYVTLRPMDIGDDRHITIDEFRNRCIVSGSCFMT